MDLLANSWHSILSLSTDVTIVLVILGILIVYALYAGKEWITALIVSLPVSAWLFTELPYSQKLLGDFSTTPGTLRNVAIFLVLLIPTMIMIGHRLSLDYPYSRAKKLIEAGALAIITAGIALSLSQSIIPIKSFYTFSTGSILWLFGHPFSLFVWTFGGILALLFILKR
jgi:hypothetical protein